MDTPPQKEEDELKIKQFYSQLFSLRAALCRLFACVVLRALSRKPFFIERDFTLRGQHERQIPRKY